MKHFIKAIKNPLTIIFVQDECGFGGYHSHLRKYGYAIKGQPATLNVRKLSKNLTLNCTIS
jgi:hypothetical protein